jgi:hypothetical protein
MVSTTGWTQDQAGAADEQKSKQSQSEPGAPEAKQRLDFGVDYFESSDGTILRGGIDYVWAPLDNHSFAATLPLVDAELAEVDGSGIGDLLLRYNWAPFQTLSASPWVPNNLGTGLGLLIPTGDLKNGTGGDKWVIAPSLGAVVKLGKRSTLLPQLQYLKSFAEGELAEETELVSLSVAFVHVTHSTFWVQYAPEFSYDFEAEQNEFDNLLVLGQQFTRRIAASLELRTMNVADPQNATGDGRELNYRATLKLHWIVAF